jgi:predicted metal-binding membrane protein
MLRHYRASVAATGGARLGLLTAIAGASYFFVWAVAGLAAFTVGVTLAAIEMRQPAVSRAVPIARVLIVLIAGSLQFTPWKTRHLSRCREMRHDTLPATAFSALRQGIRLGVRCVYCCANLTVILLLIGVMDLRAMAVVTAAINAERLPRLGERVARATGAAIVAAALILYTF